MRTIRIEPTSEYWPTGLSDLPTPPTGLYVAGDPSALLRPMVAIVGSRSCTTYGSQIAIDLARGLTSLGYVVVSGGAFGIDSAAHRGAMSGDGTTVVVLPCGSDRAYPAAHKDLFESIVDTPGCALITEYPDTTAPTRDRFLRRNELIAALADGMVVVEAALRSGSLNAARHAKELGRRLMAVPGPVTSATSSGTHRLIREGRASLVATTEDVQAELSALPHPASRIAPSR